MPVQPTKSITPSLPSGALRLDVDAGGSGVTVGADGVMVMPQFGGYARMDTIDGSNTIVINDTGGTVAMQPMRFQRVTDDFNEWTAAPQANASLGQFTARRDGIYEVGFQCAAAITRGVAVPCRWAVQIWSDCGMSALVVPRGGPVGPAIRGQTQQDGQAAVSTSGSGWQRVSQRTLGFSAASMVLTNAADTRIPFFVNKTVTMVCVRTPSTGAAATPTFPHAFPAPVRFIFGVAIDDNTVGNNPLLRTFGAGPGQTYAWMRWLGHPG
jgi:hypothetical protein